MPELHNGEYKYHSTNGKWGLSYIPSLVQEGCIMAYRVKLTSRQQLMAVPVAWLEIASGGIDETDSGCSLVYRDALSAYQVASITGGTVITEDSGAVPSVTSPFLRS